MTDSVIALVKPHVRKHFPGKHRRTRVIQYYLMSICKNFVSSGLADPKFLSEITSGERQKFWACISEAFVPALLEGKEFGNRSKIGVGPDFLILDGRRKIWIEVVCPEPIGIPDDWLKMHHTRPWKFQLIEPLRNEILLRWTNAIKSKADKLIGDANKGLKGYLDSGIVRPEDAYVIAVNSCQLRNGQVPDICGISGHPYVIEAVFSIGPRQITYKIDTLEVIGKGHQYRPFVHNKNNAEVPTNIFQEPRFNGISAIWAMDLKGSIAIGNHEPIAIIHNPKAKNPIKQGFLNADIEYETF